MFQQIERIATYSIGCVAGAMGGVILLMSQTPQTAVGGMPFFLNYWLDTSVLTYGLTIVIAGVVIGFLLTLSLRLLGKDRKLESNSRLYSEAVSIISHQMRTSLTVANWGIEIILKNYKGKLAKQDEDMLNTIIDEIKNISLQSINLLDIATVDTNRITVSFELLSLAEVEKIVKDVSEKFRHAAEKQSDLLKSEISLDHSQKIKVDPLRLRFIIENLLENALHYGGGGGKMIGLKIDNDENVMRITVSDNGIGIPLMEQEKIFTKFYRATNAREALSTGTGIGLYLCKEYTSVHNGIISFNSIPGQGTTFVVELPLNDRAQVDEFFNKI